MNITDTDRAMPQRGVAEMDVALAEGSRLVDLCQARGAFSPDRAPRLGRILTEVREWLRRVGETLPAIPLRSLHHILEVYDLLHRVAYSSPTPDAITRQCLGRLFSALTSGSREVTRTAVASVLQGQIRNNPRTVSPVHLQWYADVISRWVRELGDRASFPGVSPEESRLRLSILLRENLSPYFGRRQEEHKRRWLNASSTWSVTDNP